MKKNENKEKKQNRGWYYNLSFENRNTIWAYIFLAPWLIGILAFFLKPVVELVIYSFNKITLFQGGMDMEAVGWSNYKYIFTVHANFNQLLITTLLEAIPKLVLILILSMFLAIILNGKFKGRTIARAVFFIPIIMATNALTNIVGGSELAIVESMQAEEATNVNFITGFIVRMFDSPELVGGILKVVSNIFDTILLSGMQTLIFLGGLQSINPPLYEVARIEGATNYETFWKVTLPMLSPHILTVSVYTLAEHFMSSDLVKLAYDTAYLQSQWGYSSAMNVIFMFATVIVIGIVIAILSKGVYYSE